MCNHSPQTIMTTVEMIAVICMAKKAPSFELIKCNSWQLQSYDLNVVQKTVCNKAVY